MSVHDEDLARGARVEIALDAAERGNVSLALGILAGMSDADRREHSGAVLALLDQAAPGRLGPVADRYRAGAR